MKAGLAFVHRTGSEQAGQWLESHRWLASALRGESPAAGEELPLDRYADNPLALCFAHIDHAVAAAIFGDLVGLTRHTAAAMPLLAAVPGHYPTAVARLLRGLALAGQARAGHGDERAGLLSELDEVTGWLAERAADAPDNFLHMLRLVEAERAWAVGDFRAAVLAFDAARREVIQRRRPWHRALIAERAARFYLAHGVDQAGFDLLAQARQDYLAWGATAKVNQLDWAYPTVRALADAMTGNGDAPPSYLAHGGSAVTTGTIDLLGILSASQTLSSQISIDRLRARVKEVLSEMTGATRVRLLLWSKERQAWLRPISDDGGGWVALSGSGREDMVPMSVLRFAQRMGGTLVVGDATRDDRFARDPYFADVDCCALLALPIRSRGALQAMLLLENRLIRDAFSTERLDAVKLIAGQLAVSLDNAQLYAELAASRARIVATADQARRQIERNLHDGAQQRLVSLALELRIAQAEMSTGDGEPRMRLDRAIEQARGALEELRDLSRGIHPAILTEDGLGSALREMTGRSPIPVQLHLRVDERLPDQIEISAYYIVAEALTNAAKHSGASAITVTAERDRANGALRLQIADNGVGGAEFTGGTGLLGINDRVEALGGRIFLESPRGGGTSLRVDLPLTT